MTMDDPTLAELIATLKWYAEQTAGCRKLGQIGDPFRQALDADGGKRALSAIDRLEALHAKPVVGAPVEAKIRELVLWGFRERKSGNEVTEAIVSAFAALQSPPPVGEEWRREAIIKEILDRDGFL